MSTTVSFPGLGIGEFSVDRVAFELFGKPIYWYGVIIMLGIVAAFIHAIIRSKREGFTTDDVLDMGIFTVLFGVLGARLYYVVTTLDTHEYKNFIDVIAVWEGGLAIYGGIIAGCTALVLTAVYKKINPLKVMDAVGPGVMLAQAIGRWGNFMNGEAFGYEVAEGSLLYPFRMGLISDYTNTGSTSTTPPSCTSPCGISRDSCSSASSTARRNSTVRWPSPTSRGTVSVDSSLKVCVPTACTWVPSASPRWWVLSASWRVLRSWWSDLS